jgi:hypothetical protein
MKTRFVVRGSGFSVRDSESSNHELRPFDVLRVGLSLPPFDALRAAVSLVERPKGRAANRGRPVSEQNYRMHREHRVIVSIVLGCFVVAKIGWRAVQESYRCAF